MSRLLKLFVGLTVFVCSFLPGTYSYHEPAVSEPVVQTVWSEDVEIPQELLPTTTTTVPVQVTNQSSGAVTITFTLE